MKIKILAIASLLISLTACTDFVVGKYDEANFKNTNGNTWGIPQMRPVVWGFTGIPRDCTDCPLNQKK